MIESLVNENKILRGVKLKLFPTDEEEDYLKTLCYIRNLAHDWALRKLWDNYNSYKDDMDNYKVLSRVDLNNMFTEYRNSDDCDELLKLVQTGTARIAFYDAIISFKRLRKQIPYGIKPRYHGKHNRIRVSYGIRPDTSYILDGKLCTPNLNGLPKLRIELLTQEFNGYGANMKSDMVDKRWYNPRVVKETDGWYITFTTPRDRNTSMDDDPWTEPIGIDLGCKTTFQLSTEEFFNQPDVSRERETVSIVSKDLKRLYNLRKLKAHNSGLHVWEIPPSKRELKLVDRRNRALKRIHNRLVQFYYKVVNNIVKRKPEAIVLETIYVRDILRRVASPYVRKDIVQVYFCMIRYMFESKCDEYGIPLYEVDNHYPSSLICNRCKHKHEDLGDARTFVCPVCGYTVDRDLNASLNLRDVYVNREGYNIKWWNGHGNKLILKDKTTTR